MRFTIERLRTLVLAAGVLLVVALVRVSGRGQVEEPFNLRELPKRLGIDIQQEANGVTYPMPWARTRSSRFTPRRWCS